MQILFIIVVGFLLSGIRVIKQYERSIILTLGKYSYTLKPGFKWIIPIIQTSTRVDVREKAVDVPSQEAMTGDNIPCIINAVIYYNINANESEKSVLNVQNVHYAMIQFAQTTMRNVIGQYELDELLKNRDKASKVIKQIVDGKSDIWGVQVQSVELKDINIPDNLKRTISKQAEAEREKRAKIITAEGELGAAENLVKAAKQLSSTKGALHLRTLQSVNDMSSDQSNTVVRMLPVEMLTAIQNVGENIGKK